MARGRVIGKNGQLPWHLSADLKRFKTLTMGHPIVMGRKTHDSIGRALPGRHNIVVSRDENLIVNGADCVTSLPAALDLAADAEQVFVVGGEQIYRLALALADRIELTEATHGSRKSTATSGMNNSARRTAIQRAVCATTT